jgi:hypothetical protein
MDDIISVEAKFFEALGRFTATWAYVEMGADSVGLIIFHQYGGKTLRPNIPYSLDKKIEYLREAFETSAIPAPLADEGRKATASLASLRTDRHDFIHGLHGSFTNKNGDAVSGRLRYVPDNLFMQSRRVSVRDIEKSLPIARELARSFLGLSVSLAEYANPSLREEAAGKD